MLWKHTSEQPPTHAVLRHGSQGWDGTPSDYWVDPRNQRVLWAHNPHLPAVPPKLPAVPLPSSNRRQRREMPGLNRINRDTLRQYRAAPAFTGNSASGTASSASSVTTSGTISPTANNCLAGFVICPTAQTLSSVVDDGGAGGASLNTYTLGTPANNASGGRIYPFYGNNITGTGLHLTANLSGSATVAAIGVCEYSGVGSIAGNRTLIDASGATTGSTSSATSLSLTPQQSGALYVVGIGDVAGGITYTTSGSLTRRISLSTSVGLAIAEQVGSASSLAALNSSFTPSGAVQWAEAAIVLRPAGSQASLNFRATNGASVTLLTSGTFNPQPGWLLVAQSVTTSAGVTTTSVLDANGFTWNKLLSQSYPGGGELSVWYAWATTSATNTFTANFSGTTNAATEIWTLPGILPSANPFDVVTATTGTGTAVSIGPSAVTVIPGETAVLFTGAMGNAALTPAVGDTLAINQPTANGGNGATTRLLSATGTVTMTGTLSVSQNWVAILVTVKTGGVSLVQSVSPHQSATSTFTATLPFNSAPGNLALVNVQNFNGVAVSSLTGVNTYAKISEPINSTGAESLWYAKNIVGGKLSPSAAMASSAAGNMAIVEYSGLDATAPLDLTTAANGTGLTQSLTSTAPTFLLELAIYAYGGSGSNAAVFGTVSAPFVIATSAVFNSGQFMVAHATQFSPGAVPPAVTASSDWTGSGTTEHYGVVLATFKIAGSGAYTQGITTTNPGQGSDSSTGLLTHAGIGSATGTGSDSSTGKLTHAGVASASGTGSDAATGQLSHAGIATATGTGSTTGTGSLTHLAVASVFGTGSVTGTGLLTHPGVATSAGSGSDAASGRLTHAGVASASGTGTTSATGLLSHYGVTITNPGVGSTAATGRTIRAGVFVQLADFVETRVVVADFPETTVIVSDHLETSIAVRDGIDG